jgi:hypothetical protein
MTPVYLVHLASPYAAVAVQWVLDSGAPRTA